MHCFGEGDGSEKQETGISNRQIVLESRSSPPSPLPRWAEECWLGRTTRLNKELRRKPQAGLIAATALRHSRTKIPNWMGLSGQENVCKQQKWSSRIPCVARAA